MIEVVVDGDEVQIVGKMQALVRSKSNVDHWHSVDLTERWSERHDPGVCTCKGFEVRKTCRHLTAMRRFAAGEAKVTVKEIEDATT